MATGEGGSSRFATALARASGPGGGLGAELEAFPSFAVTTGADARALALAVAGVAPRLAASGDAPLLVKLAGLFQGVESREAFDVLREDGVPHLLGVFDARLADAAGEGPEAGAEAEALLFVLKVAALFRVEAAVGRIGAAAERPLRPESALWLMILQAFDETHPYRTAVVNRLRDPLPRARAGEAYLGLSNAVAVEGYVTDHPFDTAEGGERLRLMLTDPEPSRHTQARLATAALPFLSRPLRAELLPLAAAHPDLLVRADAARTSAKGGDRESLNFLARLCLDPGYSRTASAYLVGLGHGGLVPAEALSPRFQAAAEMAAWLAHPMEFGRPPDAVEVVDTRELYWPPTDDVRRLWLVAFRFDPDAPDLEVDRGIGLVGSITYCLFGEVTAGMEPEDVYALHCYWELEVRHDPRARGGRSVEAGRAILAAGRPVGQ